MRAGGGYDSEEVGEMSSQPWRKLWSDSDCCFSLFAIMDKQTGSQRVGLAEGDAHSCGPANMGAGSCQGERAENRRRAHSTWGLRACVSDDWLERRLFTLRGKPEPPLLQRSGAAPLKLQFRSYRQGFIFTPKNLFGSDGSELAGQETLCLLLPFFYRRSQKIQYSCDSMCFSSLVTNRVSILSISIITNGLKTRYYENPEQDNPGLFQPRSYFLSSAHHIDQ